MLSLHRSPVPQLLVVDDDSNTAGWMYKLSHSNHSGFERGGKKYTNWNHHPFAGDSPCFFKLLLPPLSPLLPISSHYFLHYLHSHSHHPFPFHHQQWSITKITICYANRLWWWWWLLLLLLLLPLLPPLLFKLVEAELFAQSTSLLLSTVATAASGKFNLGTADCELTEWLTGWRTLSKVK